MREDGSTTRNPTEMAVLTNSFYKNLFSVEGASSMEAALDVVPTKVTSQVNASLTTPFSNEEIKKALFQMFSTKAPTPDGYPAKRHWELCRTEVTNVFLRLLRGDESLEVINETILVLIPKVKDPTQLSQFRQ